MSQYIPNSHQTPNVLVDEIMELLNEGELKCYLFAIRHIYGWQDKIERGYAHISLTMFEKGYSKFSGTGLSRPTIVKSIKVLVRFRLLVKLDIKSNKGQAYSVGDEPDLDGLREFRDKPKPEVVKNLNQQGLKILTSSGKDSLPNKTHKKNKSKNTSSSAGVDNRPRNLLFDWVVENVFGIDSSMKVTKTTGARAGKCLKAIKAIHDQNGTDISVQHLNRFKQWYAQSYSQQTIPRDDKKLSEYYTEFYSSMKRLQVESERPQYVSNDWLNEINETKEG